MYVHTQMRKKHTNTHTHKLKEKMSEWRSHFCSQQMTFRSKVQEREKEIYLL